MLARNTTVGTGTVRAGRAGTMALVAGGALSAALAAPALAQTPADRYSNTPAPTRVLHNATIDQVNAFFPLGYRPTGITRNPLNPSRLDVALVSNTGPYGGTGVQYWGIPYQSLLSEINANPGRRPVVMNAFATTDVNYDIQLLDNAGGPGATLPAAQPSLTAMANAARAAGQRLLEAGDYTAGPGRFFTGITVSNSGAFLRNWAALENATNTQVNAQLSSLGHRPLDISIADPSIPTFNVITTQGDGVGSGWWWGLDFDGLVNKAAEQRSRIVDLDGYLNAQGQARYVGLFMSTNNDLAANALPLRPGAFSSSTLTAVADGFTTCGAQFNSDVWYVFTAQGRGTLTLSTCGTTVPSVVSAHSGAPGNTVNQIICASGNQSGCGPTNGSRISVQTVAGQEYFIRVATTVPLPFTLTTTFTQPNDTCAQATTIVGSGSWNFGTFGATTDGPAAVGACGATPENDVWFRWRADRDGVATLGTCGATFDTVLAVYASCPSASGQPIACNDNAGGSCGTASKVAFTAVKGTDYWVRVGGKAGAQGDGALTASIRCTPDFNDDGELTFDDIQLFVQNYNASDPSADLNGDQEWTFDDIQRFISLYNAGC